MAEVDLVITCFERTYRKVLCAGYVNNVVQQNQFKFEKKFVVINNVLAKIDAREKADKLLQGGEIDAYFFVDEHIAKAYATTGLSEQKVGALKVYTDAFLVAACTSRSKYMMHWDADLSLDADCDWLSASVALMETRPEIFVANPVWTTNAAEELRGSLRSGSFAIGDGFSDQCFLVRRQEIAAPIYDHFDLRSMRYPLSQFGLIFEARIDAYMRTHNRLRATFLDVGYAHPPTLVARPNLDSGNGSVVASADKPTPEAELLLLCARVELDVISKNRIAQLCQRDLNWNLFLISSETHGLTPLAYWHLKTICRDSLAKDKMQALAELFMSSTARSAALAAELTELLQIFEARDIIGIPFKGPVLGHHCYGDITLRTTGDLDILVPKQSVTLAIKVLRERGYLPCPWRGKELSDQFFNSAQFLNLCWEFTFFKEDEGIFVDLHWQLMAGEFLPMRMDELMRHVEKRQFQGKTVTVFDDELSLMLLCAHAAHHGFYRLNWIVDIAQMLDRLEKTDWDDYLAWARETGTERMVLLGAYLADFLPRRHCFERLRHGIESDPMVKRLGDEIIARFRNDPTAGEWKELKIWMFELSMKESWKDKLKVLLGHTTRPTIDEYRSLPLPDSLYRLYRLVKPFRLSAEHVPRVAARLLTGGYDRSLNPRRGR